MEALREPQDLEQGRHGIIGSVPINRKHSGNELLQWADLSMYSAKANGKNALRFLDPTMQVSSPRTGNWDDPSPGRRAGIGLGEPRSGALQPSHPSSENHR